MTLGFHDATKVYQVTNNVLEIDKSKTPSTSKIPPMSTNSRPAKWGWIYKSLCCFFFLTTILFAALFGVNLNTQSCKQYCKLTYDHNTVITEEVILNEAAKAGWPLTHPECNVCADATHVPIWIAPGDLCTVRQALQGSWIFCSGRYEDTEFGVNEHVKVCVSRDELKTLWDEKSCHLSKPPSADDWFALVPDSETSSAVNVGYDGTLFCKKGKSDDAQCIQGCLSYSYETGEGTNSVCVQTNKNGYSVSSTYDQNVIPGNVKKACNSDKDCLYIYNNGEWFITCGKDDAITYFSEKVTRWDKYCKAQYGRCTAVDQ